MGLYRTSRDLFEQVACDLGTYSSIVSVVPGFTCRFRLYTGDASIDIDVFQSEMKWENPLQIHSIIKWARCLNNHHYKTHFVCKYMPSFSPTMGIHGCARNKSENYRIIIDKDLYNTSTMLVRIVERSDDLRDVSSKVHIIDEFRIKPYINKIYDIDSADLNTGPIKFTKCKRFIGEWKNETSRVFIPSRGPESLHLQQIDVLKIVSIDEYNKVIDCHNPNYDAWFLCKLTFTNHQGASTPAFIVTDGEKWMEIVGQNILEAVECGKIEELTELDQMVIKTAAERYLKHTIDG